MGFGSIFKLITIILGWLGIGDKSDSQEGLEKGEQLGQAEQKAATDGKIISEVSDAEAARRSVSSESIGELRGPDEFSRD